MKERRAPYRRIRAAYTCPCCGADLTELIRQADSEKHRAAGKVITERGTAARRANAARMNAAYTLEKRRAAAQKRLATIREKQKSAKQVY